MRIEHVRVNLALPTRALTSTLDGSFQTNRCEHDRDPAPLSHSQRMSEDEHAEQHCEQLSSDRDHDKRQAAKVRYGLEDEELSKSSQECVLHEWPYGRGMCREEVYALKEHWLGRVAKHSWRDAGQAEQFGNVERLGDNVHHLGGPAGRYQEHWERQAQCQEGHREHELFPSEPRVTREQFVLRRRSQAVENETELLKENRISSMMGYLSPSNSCMN